MFINAELSQLPVGEGRKAERRIVNLAAALREEGASTSPVLVLNISATGFKADVPAEVEVGREVWLKLPGCEAKRSRAVWVEGKEAGFEFEMPFHPADLETMLAANRPRRLPKNIFGRVKAA